MRQHTKDCATKNCHPGDVVCCDCAYPEMPTPLPTSAEVEKILYWYRSGGAYGGPELLRAAQHAATRKAVLEEVRAKMDELAGRVGDDLTSEDDFYDLRKWLTTQLAGGDQ